MSTPDPSSSAAAPVWELRYLICYSGTNGQAHLDERTLTRWDAFHACQAHLCRSKEEWDRRNREIVAKQNKRFYTAVELYNAETKERRKITGDMRFILASLPVSESPPLSSTQQDGKAVNSPGSYPGDAGSTPAPATTLQTDEGTQSGGAEAPVVPESTLSAPDTDAGTPEAAPEPASAPLPVSGESQVEAAEPESAAPRSARARAPEPKPDKEKGRQGDKETPKRKPGRPAKKRP